MLGCLDIELSEGLLCQLQGREMKVVRLLQKTLFRLFVVAVNGDFFQDESWRTEEEDMRPQGRWQKGGIYQNPPKRFLEAYL